MSRLRRGTDEGFTLVELLAVCVVIGILAAIALPTFLSQKAKAQRATLHSDLRNVAAAQEAHLSETGTYGTDESVLALEGFHRSDGVSALEIAVYSVSGSVAYCVRASYGGAAAWFDSPTGRVTQQQPDSTNCPA